MAGPFYQQTQQFQPPLSPPPIQSPVNVYDPNAEPPQYQLPSSRSSTQTFNGSHDVDFTSPQHLQTSNGNIDYHQQNQQVTSPSYDELHKGSHESQNIIDPDTRISFYEQYPYDQDQNNRGNVNKHVELSKGNFIVDCPVPDKVLMNAKNTLKEEFTHMRYTAATCDPNDFISNGYMLRPHIYGRKTELMIAITMYNEDVQFFIKSMTSVIKNIAYLCSKENSKTWGKDGWQKVVVVVIADGRNKVDDRILNVLEVMGVYQGGVMQDTVLGEPVTSHIFEYTSQSMMNSNFDVEDGSLPPVQMLFCLKEKNSKKLNSHRWFFNAFAAQLNPNVCILLDVGTKPTDKSIYHLWKAFDRDPNIGGACGEIQAELGPKSRNLINPLIAAQNFEYKMSNILDKPLESVFGFISVLPGAFSAYRYRALLNTTPSLGPLAAYFKGEKKLGNGGILEANMYLAEDRILSFELVSKKNESWKLKYVKSAKAETDVPVNVPEFLSQRRRWLNGSFFAAMYSFANFKRIWTSGQPFHRKILLSIIFIYNAIQVVYTWFSIGNFYMAFYFLTSALITNQGNEIVKALYGLTLLMIFISSLGNRPQGYKALYIAVMVLFAFIMMLILISGANTVITTFIATDINEFSANFQNRAEFRNIVLSLASTYGLYIFASIIHGDPWHLATSIFQSILLVPFYINVLMVYAFCNIHDVSWGTKGDNGSSSEVSVVSHPEVEKNHVKVQITETKNINENYEDAIKKLKIGVFEVKQKRDAVTKKNDYYKQFRTNVVLSLIFSNAILVFFFTSEFWNDFIKKTYGNDSYNPYLTTLFWTVTSLSAFRAFGCVWYLILRRIFG